MSYSVQHAHDPSLKGPFFFSLAFHALVFGSLIVSTIFSHRRETWGGPGGEIMTVGLVGHLAAVPLPRPEAITPNRVVDESKGLYKPEPKPKELEAESKPIPKFERDKPPRYISKPSRVLEDPTPPPSNAVPYGQGGTPVLPYTQFNISGTAAGGLGFSGPGGDFAGRYPWYVQAVRNRISSNWLQSTVDPSVRWAPRAVLTFQILRDGSIVNVQITRSSGYPTVDNSALRAILSSSPCPALPSDYRGTNVGVEFFFEFRR